MNLNKEQLRLVEQDEMGHYLIRGIAGAGKTSVGIKRIEYLIEKYCLEDDKILFITYNKSLSKYIDYLYKKMKKEKDKGFLEDKEEYKNLDIKTIDSITYSYFCAYCKEKNYKLKIEWEVSKEIWLESIELIQKDYPQASIVQVNNMKFLKEEIKWIKGCEYVTLEIYQNIDRIGRSIRLSEGPMRLSKNSTNREAIFKLMETIDKRLCCDERVDADTSNLLALRQIQFKKAKQSYQHIIIDEAQDLTKVQLQFINCLKRNNDKSSILFLMDVAQSIYPQAWLGKGHAFTSIGYDMKGKGAKLSKNYRTTTEISQCAYSLLNKEKSIVEDANFVKPSLIERHGEYPTYRHFTNHKEQNQYVGRLINTLIKKGYKLKDIAVVSKMNSQLEILKEHLLNHHINALVFKNNIEQDFERDEVRLLTMHSVKGLEFEVVILIDINSGIIPYAHKGESEETKQSEEMTERKLLYVGMTRAKEKLFMCSYGQASSFIEDIDKEFLSMQTGSKMLAYYQLPLEKYKFKEQIRGGLGETEVIRQWLLEELITTYAYPKELIKIEYKEDQFSEVDPIDIAIIKSKTKEPYIFIKIKQREEPIQEAIDELKLCMNKTKVAYAIATNGANIAFLDKAFNYIKDLPLCPIDILPTSLEKYTFIDKRTQTLYAMEQDKSACEIIVDNKVLQKEEISTLKIYADIAAGLPIEIIDDIKGDFTLPTQWIEGKKNLFMLQVKGNSMIDAGIDNKDYVIIEPTPHIENNQIAAVEYNSATTLKKVVRMGNSILLMSENPEYEPINISEGELKIIGKLIGVIKAIE